MQCLPPFALCLFPALFPSRFSFLSVCFFSFFSSLHRSASSLCTVHGNDCPSPLRTLPSFPHVMCPSFSISLYLVVPCRPDFLTLSNLATLPHNISSLCTYVYSIKSIAYTPVREFSIAEKRKETNNIYASYGIGNIRSMPPGMTIEQGYVSL